MAEVLDDRLGHLRRRYVRRDARPKVGIIGARREPVERFDLAEAYAKVERIVRFCISITFYRAVVVSEQTTGGQQIISGLQLLCHACRRPGRNAGHDNNCKQYSPYKHHHIDRAVGALFLHVVPLVAQGLKKLSYTMRKSITKRDVQRDAQIRGSRCAGPANALRAIASGLQRLSATVIFAVM
jgi:hypothetical protein